jgi:hypothetical protein
MGFFYYGILSFYWGGFLLRVSYWGFVFILREVYGYFRIMSVEKSFFTSYVFDFMRKFGMLQYFDYLRLFFWEILGGMEPPKHRCWTNPSADPFYFLESTREGDWDGASCETQVIILESGFLIYLEWLLVLKIAYDCFILAVFFFYLG